MSGTCTPEPQAARPDASAGHPLRRATARVVAVERPTSDISVLRLQVVDGGPFVFSAGQYARVSFGRLPERDYSIASRPDEPLLEFHIRDMDAGPSAYVNRELQPGETVRLRGPFGDTYLREGHAGAIVAVAGGSGLAPIKAIVETALAKGMTQPIHLYFGVRSEDDVYYEERLLALARRHGNLRYVPVLSDPQGATRRRRGPLPEVLASDFDDLREAIAYLAGPPSLVEAAARALRRLGLPAERIHADAFIGEDERYRLEGDK